jgi:hypothetical protein
MLRRIHQREAQCSDALTNQIRVCMCEYGIVVSASMPPFLKVVPTVLEVIDSGLIGPAWGSIADMCIGLARTRSKTAAVG